MNNLISFKQSNIRKVWHNEQWYFSIIDIVSVLTDSSNPTDYLKKLRKRDIELGVYLGTNCPQVEMKLGTGKIRKVLAANTETILRLIQSVPSKKAEPLKLWLAKVGNDRIKEIQDPSLAYNRAREYWKKQGRSDAWIKQRITGQDVRNKLTEYWKEHNVQEGEQFAVLTNIIHQEWAEIDTIEHKKIKSLKPSHNLRDHMHEAELIITALAEFSTKHIAEHMQAEGFEENKVPAQKGGKIAKHARQELEKEVGKSIISQENFLP